MENLSTLQAFLVQERDSIETVLFKPCKEDENSIYCEITFKGSLSLLNRDRNLLIATINTFIVTFGAVLHGESTSTSIKLLICIKVNK